MASAGSRTFRGGGGLRVRTHKDAFFQIEEAVRNYRGKPRLSQEAFADKAGVHRTSISAIELGKVQVSIAVAEKLAAALETSLSSLFRTVEKTMDRENPA